MKELVFPYLHISIEHSTSLLYSVWLREPGLDEYKEGMKQLVECLERYPVFYWIQDSTHLAHVSLECQRQTLHQMAPSVTGSQLRKIARITARDFAYMAMFDEVVEEELNHADRNHTLGDRKIEVQQFASYEEAADWIADIKV
ncbi:hypothetical protein OB13_11375 [Pontibacter sp. HJ8]